MDLSQGRSTRLGNDVGSSLKSPLDVHGPSSCRTGRTRPGSVHPNCAKRSALQHRSEHQNRGPFKAPRPPQQHPSLPMKKKWRWGGGNHPFIDTGRDREKKWGHVFGVRSTCDRLPRMTRPSVGCRLEPTFDRCGWMKFLIVAWIRLYVAASVQEGNDRLRHPPAYTTVTDDDLDQVLTKAVFDLQRRQGELDCMYERLGQVVQKDGTKGNRKEGWASGRVVSSN